MPVYDFKCKVCGHQWEQKAGVSDEVACPHCGGEPIKIIGIVNHYWVREKP